MNSTSITILKRPNDQETNQERNEASRNRSLQTKTLEQKQADYAAARLRILGPNSEIKLDKDDSPVKGKKSPVASGSSSASSESSTPSSSPANKSPERTHVARSGLEQLSLDEKNAKSVPRKPYKMSPQQQGIGPLLRIPITSRPPPASFIDANSLLFGHHTPQQVQPLHHHHQQMFPHAFPPPYAYPMSKNVVYPGGMYPYNGRNDEQHHHHNSSKRGTDSSTM